jgi:DNA uptake protein ComE-like DNA-binding protein
MGYRVQKERRVKHNSKIYTPGQVIPLSHEEAESLLVDDAIYEDETATPPPSDDAKADSSTTTEIINLNTATDAQLRSLPLIGASLAKKLRDARPFESMEAAQVASGIAPDQWSQLEPLISL